MKRVVIYSDGACWGNPGPGGWGVVLLYDGQRKEISGGAEHTTNNRMELQAAIEGLKALKEPGEADFYTDSQYLQQGISSWIEKWKTNSWRTASKQPVKNEDLWRDLDRLVQLHHVNWHWLRGHVGTPENERADRLAKSEIRQILDRKKGAGRPIASEEGILDASEHRRVSNNLNANRLR